MVENNDDLLDLEFMDVDVIEFSTKISQNFVYVDIQGFKTSRNRFMCKEFCLVEDDFVYHALVKSPYSISKLPKHYRRQADWLTGYYHGIKYGLGDVHMNDLKKDVFPRLLNKKILVKGLEKISWLKQIFHDYGEIEVMNVEDIDGFDLSKRNSEPYKVCDYHDKVFKLRNGPCAKSTALMLQDVTMKSFFLE